LLISFLALALVLSGCSNGSTDDNRPAWQQALDDGYQRGDFASLEGSGNGTHVLLWGIFDTTIGAVNDTIISEGWSVTQTDSGNAGWATGNDAKDILEFCVANVGYHDVGIEFDSYAALVNFTKDGIGASIQAPGLKAALSGKEGDVPVTGIFDSNQGAVVVFVDSKE
jgi:hypothetical protein